MLPFACIVSLDVNTTVKMLLFCMYCKFVTFCKHSCKNVALCMHQLLGKHNWVKRQNGLCYIRECRDQTDSLDLSTYMYSEALC